jgi:Zn-finger nucleic acid-binding protein
MEYKKKEKEMKCPRDNSEMVKTTREEIEIDYCPECRGVWLERGELTKIIDRAAADINDRGVEGEKKYPDISGKRERMGYDPPGHFFGRLFDY